MMSNEYTVTIKLKRGQLCRLLILLAAHIGTLRYRQGGEDSCCLSSYELIHNELRAQLAKFDEETARRKGETK